MVIEVPYFWKCWDVGKLWKDDCVSKSRAFAGQKLITSELELPVGQGAGRATPVCFFVLVSQIQTRTGLVGQHLPRNQPL
jgi:hypothetical protein